MSTPPSVFIIILQYNNSEDTIKCLNSVKELGYPNFRTIVVDNASDKLEQDNIREYVKSQLGGGGWGTSKISLIFNAQNLGYAGGNNIGIKYALSEGADYIFIINNDTTIGPDTLDRLMVVAEKDPQVGVVGPTIIEPERTVYFGKVAWLKPELRHSSVPPRTTYLQPKEYLIGAGLLIKKKVLEKVEGFDEIYFLYFEDADFSIRAQLAGYKLQIVPDAIIHHQTSASTRRLGAPLLLRYHMRNALIFNSLDAPWAIKPFLIFWAGYVLIKNLFKIFLLPSKEESANAIIDGVLDFYKNQFGKINA